MTLGDGIPIYAGTTIPHVGLFLSGNESDATMCCRCWGRVDDYRHDRDAIARLDLLASQKLALALNAKMRARRSGKAKPQKARS